MSVFLRVSTLFESYVTLPLIAFDSIGQLLFVGALEAGFGQVQVTIEEDCSRYMDGLGWDAEKQGESFLIMT